MGEVTARQEWATPDHLIAWVVDRIGPLVCDVAASAGTTKAAHWYGPGSPHGEDGLRGWWPDSGAIWCNPPYAQILPWVDRARSHVRSYPEARVLMLLPPRTDQEWWHDLARDRHAEVCAIRPRLEFVPAQGISVSAPSFPVVLWELTQQHHQLPTTYVWRASR